MRKPGEHPASLTSARHPNPTSTHMQWLDGMLNGLELHVVILFSAVGGRQMLLGRNCKTHYHFRICLTNSFIWKRERVLSSVFSCKKTLIVRSMFSLPNCINGQFTAGSEFVPPSNQLTSRPSLTSNRVVIAAH